jgi:hypothetical protein
MSAQKDESFEAKVLIMGGRATFAVVAPWFVLAIGLGLLVKFAMDFGLDNRIAAAIYLPCFAGLMFKFIRSAMGVGARLSVRDGVLEAKRGRHEVTVALHEARPSWGHWTSGTGEGGAQLTGPVLILQHGDKTTSVGCVDPELAVSLGAHLAPLVRLDPEFVIPHDSFRELLTRVPVP